MDEHMVTYHQGFDFKCGLCYQIFTSKDVLESHIKNIHKNEMDLLNNRLEPNFSLDECKVSCNVCDTKFMTAISCKYHKSQEHDKQ